MISLIVLFFDPTLSLSWPMTCDRVGWGNFGQFGTNSIVHVNLYVLELVVHLQRYIRDLLNNIPLQLKA